MTFAQDHLDILYLAVGVSIARAIESKLNIDVGLKWPNKVTLRNKVVSIYSIETLKETGNNTIYKVRVLLNLYSSSEGLGGLEISLATEVGSIIIEWSSLANELINEINEAVQDLREGITSKFVIEYLRRLASLGEEVQAVSDLAIHLNNFNHF